jgi:hypothetical protein
MIDAASTDFEEPQGQSDDAIIALCKARFQLCVDSDDADRQLGLDDLNFLWVDQWDANARRARELDGRPCLSSNVLPSILHQVTNDNRQNRQSIHIHPANDDASEEVAEVLEGLIRHIEYDSNADTAYDTAVASAASIGFGWFRLISEYESPTSFDQVLKVKRVRNAFTVYLDPEAVEMDGSDARFAIITSKMAKEDFKREYPKATVTYQTIGRAVGTDNNNWVWSDQCRVTEYYTIIYKPATLCLYSDGTTALKSEKVIPAFGVTMVKERATSIPQVMWYKVTAFEVLEKAEIPCQWIPVFPVWGDEVDLNGQTMRRGLIRNAKDPIKMANFWETSATEEVAMRTKTPYIGAVGQFESMESDWASANQRQFSYLEYNPITVDGTVVGAPQRQPMADVPVGALAMLAHSRDNIKAVTGIYDASLGARGNETSGKGIMARQRQGDIANFHYADNLAKAIRHLGRCMISMIPHIYDTERVIRILGEDESATHTVVNQPNPDPQPDPETGAVQKVLNDLTVGEYDVVVSSGPSYSTLRQEAVDSMTAVGQAYPRLWEIAGDKMVKAMDWPGADDISERIKRTIPPAVLGEEDEDAPAMVQTSKGPIPAQQAGQLIEQMDAATAAMHEELTTRDKEIEKARISADASVRVAEINAQSRHDDTELDGMIKLLLAGQDAMQARIAAMVSAQSDRELAAQDAAQRAALAEHAAQLTPSPAPGDETGAQGSSAPAASGAGDVQ